MADFNGKKFDEFGGINKAVSERDDTLYLQDATNLDSNVVKGKMTLRQGSKLIVDDATTDINKFIEYRDEDNGKDVLLVLDKDSTVADRRLWFYTRTAGSTDQYARQDGAGPPDYSGGLSYGNVNLGDSDFGLTFFPYRNFVRIGTGNNSKNKALMFGYYNRTGTNGILRDSSGGRLEFSGYYLTKQQWVQQCDLFSGFKKILFDDDNSRQYALTNRGVEIRDTAGYVEKILNDVVAWDSLGIRGGLSYDDTNNYLYATGKVPNSSDTKIVRYDISKDYEMDASDTFTGTDYVYGVYADGTYVYVTYSDSTDIFVKEYALDLSSDNDRATVASYNNPLGMAITGDATYVYFSYEGKISRMLKASPYTLTHIFTSAYNIHDLAAYDSKVHMLHVLNAGATTQWYRCDNDGSNSVQVGSNIDGKCYGIHDSDGDFGVSNYTYGYYLSLRYTAATPTYSIGYYRPNKMSISPENMRDAGNAETYFYAMSIVDIWGQEHHLMSGVAGDIGNLTVYVNVDAENYNDLSSPSTDIDESNSIWNEFRKIDKIRVYRAYSATGDDKEPTTNYRFLREVDFDDARWDEESANKRYSLTINDDVGETEMSSVTYAQSSGLIERFRPYYVNWKYAHESNNYFYYGNMYIEDTYKQKFVQTRLNSPDICYQLDDNFENFGYGDGDEIVGFAKSDILFYVLKKEKSALYDGLNKRRDYDIGTYAPDSIVDNYFISKDGIYYLLPNSYIKISNPVDDLFLSNSSLEGASGALYRKHNKIIWLIPDSDGLCMVYNFKENTWDKYKTSYASGTVLANQFITQGADGRVLSSASTLNKILEWHTGYADGATYAGTGGNNISIYLQTADFTFGEEVINASVKKLLATIKSTDTITLGFYYINDNGNKNTSITLSAQSTLKTVSKWLQSVWGQSGYFLINQAVTGATEIDMLGFELKPKGKSRL